jgi:hypothetical protein
VTGAGNQQERLRTEGWVVGFVDGEGCFCVNINRCSALRLGWQVRPEFVVTQGAKSVVALELLRDLFSCGEIYRNARRADHRKDLFRWCVRRRVDLDEKVVPFFATNPLRTAKRHDFELFVEVLALMREERHLTLDGIAQIARTVELMNHRKPSAFLSFLRDCTPAAS